MESYWCSRKNSIFEMIKDPENFNNALIPCHTSSGEKWKDGGVFTLPPWEISVFVFSYSDLPGSHCVERGSGEIFFLKLNAHRGFTISKGGIYLIGLNKKS